MGKIDHICSVEEDNQYGVGNQVDGIKNALIPSLFAKSEGEDGKQDEEAVGPKDGHRIEKETTFGNLPSFLCIADMA